MLSNIVMPSLGATGGDIEIEHWLVAEGDFVEAGRPLFVAATDKATVDIEAFRSGYVRRILVAAGGIVALGQTVAVLADSLDEPLGPEETRHMPAAASVSAGPQGTEAQVGSAKNDRAHVRPQVVERTDASSDDCLSEPAPMTAAEGLAMYRRMVLIRRFEDYLYQLFLQGLVPGTLHQYQGQEAVAVGVSTALRADDWVLSTHRPVGHLLAKGASPRSIAAEIWGKATGCAGGVGGQMHLADVSIGAPPSNAIVGANIPIATGVALGFLLRGENRVAVSYFGDGAANIGAAHEGMNLAAVKRAPVLFVCENNLYGASTHQSLAMRIADVASRAAGYGMPGVIVDGMDVFAVRRAASEAVRRARRGLGPTLFECKTYRYQGHSRGDPGGYRSREELAHWKSRDPIPHCRALLVEQFGRGTDELDEIDRQCQQEVVDAVEFARASADPAPEAITRHVFAPRSDRPAGASPAVPTRQIAARRMSMAEALRDGLRVAMQADSAVFILGEDVGVTGGFGGGFTVTLGLSDEFGHERVMDTPISEIAIVGAAVGAALGGMRAVAEMQYGDFVFCAMDQVVNQAAKMHYMSNGQLSVPLVLRLPVGASLRGCQHGQSTEAYFMHTPGLKVVCPSNPYDAKGLLLAAIRDGNPVMFLEHKLLYGAKGGRQESTSLDPVSEVPIGDYEVPHGTWAVRREGSQVTVVANMLMVHRALAAADALASEGISIEVLDARSLVPMDMDCLLSSVRKTQRVLIVEEDTLTGGWGAEVVARLASLAFHDLKAPPARLAAPDAPLPCAASLERRYVPSVERIVAALREIVVG